MRGQNLLIPLLLLSSAPALARPAPPWPGEPDRVSSPYLFVETKEPGVDKLPLKGTRADVQIAGTIAQVKVTQVYKNEGSRPIEAVYVFPGSTRSAVFGMRMTIGGRTIVAKVDEKAAARQIYETAKSQGKTASLLEQQRPNVFQMNVANVLPGDEVRIELDYVELLLPTDGIYEFSYPSVVGPRYPGQGGQPSAAGETWAANPYLPAGAPVPFTWGVSVNLQAGMPIKGVMSTSHRISPRYGAPDKLTVEVDETTGGNKDFILRYRLADDRIQTGALLFPGDKEKFFLVMAQPPARLNPTMIPPREYIFVLDVSGSMHGFPLDTAKALMRSLFSQLRPQDSFNVMTFSGGNNVLSERSLPANAANLERAIAAISREQGGGGTEIVPALKRALALPRERGVSTSIVVVTDGYVSVESECFDIIAGGLGTANLFAFGIGSSINRFLIEGMARAGMGEPFFVTGPAQAAEVSESLRKMLETPVLTDVRVSFEGFDAYDVEPRSVPDLLAERPLILFGKYRGAPQGRVLIGGQTGSGSFSDAIALGAAQESAGNGALRYLWARHRIQRSQDHARMTQRAESKREVTALGLEYNLLTDYTSFVAVDETVRNPSGQSTSVKQPIPMPEGVSDLAVGPSAASYGVGGLGAAGRGIGGGGGRGSSAVGVAPPKESKREVAGQARGGVLSGLFGQAAPVPASVPEPSMADANKVKAVPALAAEDDELSTGRDMPGRAKDGDVAEKKPAKGGLSLTPTPGVSLVCSHAELRAALEAVLPQLRSTLATRGPSEKGTLQFQVEFGADGRLSVLKPLSGGAGLSPEFQARLKTLLRTLRVSGALKGTILLRAS